MSFPNVPNAWDLALFIVGSFFVYTGITQSYIWLLFLGVIFLELAFQIFVLFIIVAICENPNISREKQDQIAYVYLAICVAAIVITIIILSYLYFNFNIIREIGNFFKK